MRGLGRVQQLKCGFALVVLAATAISRRCVFGARRLFLHREVVNAARIVDGCLAEELLWVLWIGQVGVVARPLRIEALADHEGLAGQQRLRVGVAQEHGLRLGRLLLMVHQVELRLGARVHRQPSILMAFGITFVITPVTGQAER